MKKIFIALLFFVSATSFAQVQNSNTKTFVTGQATQTAIVNNILTTTSGAAATDVSFYNSFQCQVVSTGTGGTFIFEGSNDGVNFQPAPVYNQGLTAPILIGAAITATASQALYSGNCLFKYLRLRIVITITGGNIQAFTTYSKLALSSAYEASAQASGSVWTTNIGNTANTTPILANPLIPVGTTTGDLGAKTATFNGATQTNTTACGVQVVFNVGTVTGTTPTMVCKLQGSADAGTTWFDLPNATTATLTASGVYGIQLRPSIMYVAGVATTATTACVNATLPRTWRAVYTIGGTTPSFTLTNVQVVYLF